MYYDKSNKTLFNSELTNSLREYVKNENIKKEIINFYPDQNHTSQIKASISFFKFFYLHRPMYVFLKSDWMSKKTIDVSLYVMIILKLIEKNTIFISRSGDPNWINNKIRSKVSKKIFNAHISLPQIFIKKTNQILPFPEYGVPNDKIHAPSIHRPNNIFYIGRLPKNDERSKTISFLKDNNVKIKIYGEDTKNFLGKNEFYNIYRNSKITINFPKQVNSIGITSKYAFRGRVIDALSHGVLLFDQRNEFMDILFKANEHYIHYDNQNDLLEKINFYSKNYENEGIKIANNGYQIIKNKYRPIHVWPKIFKNL